MSDEEECPPCPVGMPGWVMTFADLMSLLMCFFVLLLAFSEMDVMKYKQVAGSMREAFGVQNEIKKKDIPRGTSVVAQEFSPGRPDPTPLNEVRQKTTDMTKSTLDVICEKNSESLENETTDVGGGNESGRVIMINKLEELVRKTQADAMNIAEALEEEIRNGQVEVETNGQEIIIRVRENGSFPSGSSTLQASFIPIMAKIRKVLAFTPGVISVEGHSDNVPIHTDRFRSNWDLSSARAVSVAHELLMKDELSAERLSVSGYADTKPLLPNESRKNMAINRRVEIIISQTDLLQDDRETVDLDAEADFQGDVQGKLGGTANVNTREDEINRDQLGEGQSAVVRGPTVRTTQEAASLDTEAGEKESGANQKDENEEGNEGESGNVGIEMMGLPNLEAGEVNSVSLDEELTTSTSTSTSTNTNINTSTPTNKTLPDSTESGSAILDEESLAPANVFDFDEAFEAPDSTSEPDSSTAETDAIETDGATINVDSAAESDEIF